MKKLERKVEIPKVLLGLRESRLVNGEGEVLTSIGGYWLMELTPQMKISIHDIMTPLSAIVSINIIPLADKSYFSRSEWFKSRKIEG